MPKVCTSTWIDRFSSPAIFLSVSDPEAKDQTNLTTIQEEIYGGEERRAADHGPTGHGRPRELERAGARRAGQVLVPADPGQRCRGVRHPARGGGLGRPAGTLREDRDDLLRPGARGPDLRDHLPGLAPAI